MIGSLYRAEKQIFLNQCHSCDLGSRSQKGHPLHFPRPIYCLSQICKVWHKQFWHERQKNVRCRKWRLVTPLLMHLSYQILALSNWCSLCRFWKPSCTRRWIGCCKNNANGTFHCMIRYREIMIRQQRLKILWSAHHNNGLVHTDEIHIQSSPDSKVHGDNMGTTWVLSAPDGPHEPCYQGPE